MLTLGVPKEIKTLEKRVGLTPEGVQTLCSQSIPILIQSGAGSAAGFPDEAYRKAGAQIVDTAAEVYAGAELIQKIKEPLPAEYPLFRREQIIFSFLHLAAPSECELVRQLVRSNVTAIGFETLEKNGLHPLLAPMSRIAGALSAAYAAYIRYDQCLKDGKIVYGDNFLPDLEKIADVYPKIPAGLSMGSVLIFGGGVAGESAMKFALEMGGRATVVEMRTERRDALRDTYRQYHDRLKLIAPDEVDDEILKDVRVLIGCVHQTGKRAARVLDENQMQRMAQSFPKLIMDISIDQGGNFPEARPTSYAQPLDVDSYGHLRFCVPNIPSFCGAFASEEITREAMPYTLALATEGEKALTTISELQQAVNVAGGTILNEAVRSAHKR